jgi:hypothetical protein
MNIAFYQITFMNDNIATYGFDDHDLKLDKKGICLETYKKGTNKTELMFSTFYPHHWIKCVRYHYVS